MKIKPNDSILILSHYYKRASTAGGPPQDLRDYLVDKTGSVVYIEHPFPYADDHASYATIYEKGRLIKILKTPALTGPQAWFYVADIFLTWYFLIRIGKYYRLCIALDNLNTLSVLPFRWLGKIKTLVFYTIDYTPHRFVNIFLNNLYLTADKIACQLADVIWILSDRMITARQAAGVRSPQNEASIVVPMGAHLDRIKPLPFEKINRHQLIFVGHLLEKQGLQLVIEALPKLVTKIPDLRLIVIGQGEYQQVLEKQARSLKVEKIIKWRGFVESHQAVEEELCHSAIGLAPYIPSETSFTYFTDPGKPKLYLGCSLPVIITDFPASASLIKDAKAGLIVEPSVESISQALLKLLTDDSLYKAYRANALRLAAEYNTDSLFARALDKTHETR